MAAAPRPGRGGERRRVRLRDTLRRPRRGRGGAPRRGHLPDLAPRAAPTGAGRRPARPVHAGRGGGGGPGPARRLGPAAAAGVAEGRPGGPRAPALGEDARDRRTAGAVPLRARRGARTAGIRTRPGPERRATGMDPGGRAGRSPRFNGTVRVARSSFPPRKPPRGAGSGPRSSGTVSSGPGPGPGCGPTSTRAASSRPTAWLRAGPAGPAGRRRDACRSPLGKRRGDQGRRVAAAVEPPVTLPLPRVRHPRRGAGRRGAHVPRDRDRRSAVARRARPDGRCGTRDGTPAAPPQLRCSTSPSPPASCRRTSG